MTYHYENLFYQTFIDFIETIKESRLNDTKYCLFYPMIGKNFFEQREILIVGRAVNSWGSEGSHWTSLDKIDGVVEDAILESDPASEGKCALDWVNEIWDNNDSNISHSAFWQLTYKLIMNAFGRDNNNWSNIMVYSNLFKIAPAFGGNPTRKLEWDGQLENCKKLFLQELSELQPKYVILITDLGWAEEFVPEIKRLENEFVKGIARIENSNIIITVRPERKPQIPFIEEVKRYLM